MSPRLYTHHHRDSTAPKQLIGMWNGGPLSYRQLLMPHYKPRLRLPSGLPPASGVSQTLGADIRMGGRGFPAHECEG